jgi:hypothetical protein
VVARKADLLSFAITGLMELHQDERGMAPARRGRSDRVRA